MVQKVIIELNLKISVLIHKTLRGEVFMPRRDLLVQGHVAKDFSCSEMDW